MDKCPWQMLRHSLFSHEIQCGAISLQQQQTSAWNYSWLGLSCMIIGYCRMMLMKLISWNVAHEFWTEFVPSHSSWLFYSDSRGTFIDTHLDSTLNRTNTFRSRFTKMSVSLVLRDGITKSASHCYVITIIKLSPWRRARKYVTAGMRHSPHTQEVVGYSRMLECKSHGTQN